MKKRKLIFIFLVFILILFLFQLPKSSKNPRIQILDEKNNEIVYLINLNKTNSENLSNLNSEYINYILTIEDKHFYDHQGFYLPRIIKSIWNNIFHFSKEGGSTITQQYIKNTYLNNKRSIFRKIKEIYLAIKLENISSKEEILSDYLSSLYFGNNVYGLTNAASYYYDKDVSDLTQKEMISLIALWNAPTIYSNHIEKWNNKKNELAKKLNKNGILNDVEYQQVIKDIELKINKNYMNSNRLYYIDQVINELKKINVKSKFNETIKIYTCYHKETEKVKSNLDINYAVISLNEDGYFTSCVGNKDYNTSSFNIAMNGKRDIGSTIKPLLYYEAILCGFENKYFNSEIFSFPYKDDIITISNNTNHYYNTINMRQALAVSDNIYATKMHLELGMNTLVNHLKKYDIEANPYPSLALGSVGMSLKQLLCIYYQFFSKGYYIQPKFIKLIEIGTLIYNFKTKKTSLNNPTICKKVHDLLSSPFDTSIPYATCSSISNKLNTKCYGKSGLTDYDSYMIGYNEKNLVAVWTGDIENKILTNSDYKKLPKELFTKMINSF